MNFRWTLAFLAAGLCAQTPTESQFIASVNAAIASLNASTGQGTHAILFSGNLIFADGKNNYTTAQVPTLLAYVDGLKAAGCQRIDINPGVTTVTNPTTQPVLDAVVAHIHELGLQLSINPEVTPGELGQRPTFSTFQTTALQTYAEMASRYQPDNFVILHEPTTATGSLGLATSTVQQWHNFIVAAAPLIKAASPHTRLGAGAYQNGVLPNLSAQEDAFFQDAATIPALDFMTMDIYNDDTFPVYQQWITLAHGNGKGIYIEETGEPKYLPNPLPATLLNANGYLTESLDSISLIGSADVDFAPLDASWLQAMANWASANGMEALTAFETEPFFALGTAGHDTETDTVYVSSVSSALSKGQLSSTGQAYFGIAAQYGIKTVTDVNNASYATLSGQYGTYGNNTIAPDSLVSAFGTDLAGASIELVDSTNASYSIQPLYAASGQLNYVVPSAVQNGAAWLTMTSADGTVSQGVVLIAAVSPGIYDAVEVTAGDATYLELYGTGLRHASSLAAVSVQVGNQALTPTYVGPQGQFPGLDQVNVQLPSSLAGSGSVKVMVKTLDTGAVSNAVTVNIQ